jgi:hypothetical protein
LTRYTYDFSDRGLKSIHDSTQRIAQIPQQVPAVRYLDSLWRTRGDSFDVVVGAVTSDEFNFRMSLVTEHLKRRHLWALQNPPGFICLVRRIRDNP